MNQEIQTVKDNAVDQEILVTKRDGSKESIDLEKIHRVVHWASQDLENISVSQVEINAQLAFLMASRLKIFMKPSLNLLQI